jgi:hypothetical protein
MRIYTVHAAPGGDGTATADPIRFVFIKEGFCWPALFIPELWLLFRRMWLVLVLYIAANAAAVALMRPGNAAAISLILVLARLLFAIEANGLRRWTLERHGYRLIGVAEGGRLREAEYRFFSDWLASGRKIPAAASPAPPAPPPPAAPSAEGGEVVGLFPVPGGGS